MAMVTPLLANFSQPGAGLKATEAHLGFLLTVETRMRAHFGGTSITAASRWRSFGVGLRSACTTAAAPSTTAATSTSTMAPIHLTATTLVHGDGRKLAPWP